MRRILLIFILFTLISVTLVSACIFPDSFEFYYPINFEKVKFEIKNLDLDYEIINNTILLDYNEFTLGISNESVVTNCKQPIINCLDNSTLRSILDDLESWGAYDLSKQDKDTIASLYERNIIIRQLEKKDLIKLKIKGFISKIIGKFICTNYEKVNKCINNWCSLKLIKSKGCPILRC